MSKEMSREEAIEKLELMRQRVDEETYRALILAIKALEQESCGDAISRQAVKEWLWDNAIYGYDRFIDKLPSVNPQPICEDAISREAVIKAVDTHTNEDGTLDDDISVILEDLPSVNPQEPKTDVLDKIIAEIEELDRYYDNDYFSANNCPMYKCDEVLQIIDKYKVESEGE